MKGMKDGVLESEMFIVCPSLLGNRFILLCTLSANSNLQLFSGNR